MNTHIHIHTHKHTQTNEYAQMHCMFGDMHVSLYIDRERDRCALSAVDS